MKILLIKRGALGDVLMTTPLIRQLRNNFPAAQLDYAIGDSCQIALKNNPYLNNIIILRDKAFSLAGIGLLLKFIWSIRGKYDHIFVLGKNWNVNLLFKFAGGNLIGFAREKVSRWILDSYVIYNDTNRYQVLYYLDLLEKSGLAKVDFNDLQMNLTTLEEDKNAVATYLNEFLIERFVVVTNSGGNNNFETSGIRMLPETKVLQLLELLLSKYTVILLGGKIDEINYQRYQQQLNNPKNLYLAAGIFSLAQSIELLKLAEHFYVTDCGSMHLGLTARINNKMTCFFGPTNPRHILPENFAGIEVWQDQDIFDPVYQISGKIHNPPVKYFKHLSFNRLIR